LRPDRGGHGSAAGLSDLYLRDLHFLADQGAVSAPFSF